MSHVAPEAGLFLSRVMHARVRPVRRSFTYRVFSLLLDIDDVGATARGCAILSYNRFNILSFRDRDHGRRDGSPLRPWVEETLRQGGVAEQPEAIRLLCFPRLWGLVFNPLSVFYCYRAGALFAVIYEVNNTFGDTHAYVARAIAGPNGQARHEADKVLYVSPLIGMEARYEFAVRSPETTLSLAIRESGPDGLILTAAQTGKRRPLSTWEAVKAVLKHPLMTLKIVAAIHVEALGIWLRGAQFVNKPLSGIPAASSATPSQSGLTASTYVTVSSRQITRAASMAAE